MNTPAFGGQAPSAPAEEPLIVFTENYYAATFLEPGRAEAVCSRDVRRALEMIFRRGWYWDVENMRGYPPDSAEKTMDMLRMIEEDNYPGASTVGLRRTGTVRHAADAGVPDRTGASIHSHSRRESLRRGLRRPGEAP